MSEATSSSGKARVARGRIVPPHTWLAVRGPCYAPMGGSSIARAAMSILAGVLGLAIAREVGTMADARWKARERSTLARLGGTGYEQ